MKKKIIRALFSALYLIAPGVLLILSSFLGIGFILAVIVTALLFVYKPCSLIFYIAGYIILFMWLIPETYILYSVGSLYYIIYHGFAFNAVLLILLSAIPYTTLFVIKKQAEKNQSKKENQDA